MAAKIRCVEYFYITVPDKPGAACQVLFELSSYHVNLLAFSAVPVGPENTQLVLFPDSLDALARAAEKSGFVLSGPQRAFLIQGDDRLGALVAIHETLANEGINVYASSGVTDGKGSFGYVIYVKSTDYDDATRVLGAEPLHAH